MKNNTKMIIFWILAIPFGYKASMLITNIAGEWLMVISCVFLMMSCYYFGKHISEMDVNVLEGESNE